MKKLIAILMLTLFVGMVGCEAAKEAAKDAADKTKDKVADMANIDFGDFDMSGMNEKIAGITDGIKGVTADNVGGLTSKITEFTGSLDGMGIDGLAGPAKTAVTGVLSQFVEAIKSALGGISDDGILSKLKPVVDALIEKIGAFK